MKPALLIGWIAVSVLWGVAVAYVCLQGWPRMSMDMAPNDPATKAALTAAANAHLLRYGLIGVLPPLAAFLALRLGRRG